MIFVIYEKPANIVNSVYEKFYARYPDSCICRLGPRPSAQELDVLKYPPLLMPGWLVICPSRVSRAAVDALESCRASNVILVQCVTREEMFDTAERLDGTGFKTIDNHAVDKKAVVDWIAGQSGCDYDTAGFLYKRLGGNLQDIVMSMPLLRFMPEVNKGAVKAYIKKSARASVDDIVPYILGIQRKWVQKKDVVMVIYRFRYAFPWLVRELRRQADECLAVFRAVSSGDLDINNYIQYHDIAESREMRALSLAKLKFLVMSFGRVSMEHVYLVKTQLDGLPASRLGIVRLIYLLQIGG